MASLFIPVILGTARKGRRSENAAHFIFDQTKARAGVETEFVDIAKIPMRLDDAGEQMKDPALRIDPGGPGVQSWLSRFVEACA